MTQAEKAKVYATHKHTGQIHGTRPFTTHLAEVVGVLHEFGYLDDNLTAAAWLHDVVEDTPVVIEEIYSEFGDRIGDLVDALTDGEGKTRMEKKQKPYATIPNVSGAVIVKLADRILELKDITKLIKGNIAVFATLLVRPVRAPRCGTFLIAF